MKKLEISHIDPLINQINDLIKESGLSSIEELQNSQNWGRLYLILFKLNELKALIATSDQISWLITSEKPENK